MYPMLSSLGIYIIISLIIFKNVKFATAVSLGDSTSAHGVKLSIKWKIGQSICTQYREFFRTKKIHSRRDYNLNHEKPDFTEDKYKCRFEWHSCSSKKDSRSVCQKFTKKDCGETINKGSRGMSMKSRSLGRSVVKIANGADADPTEFPYFVAFLKKTATGTENRFPFGGAMFNATHVITSAKAGCEIKWWILFLARNGYGPFWFFTDDMHPFQIICTSRKHKLQAMISAYNRKEDEKTKEIIDVKKVYVYPFKKLKVPNHVNDIAMIELSKSATVVGEKPFLRLARVSDEEDFDPLGCTAIGFGSYRPVEDGAPIYEPSVLQKVQLKILDEAECVKKFDGWNKMTERHLCGYPDGNAQGICEGDIGGPLICNDKDSKPYLAGIASLNKSPCAQYDHASGFTRINRFAGWIKGTIHC